MSSFQISQEQNPSEWQVFVQENGRCGLYHHFGWKNVIESAYGHRTYYLSANRDGEITGILPLVLISSRVFGRSMTSLPFVDFAGLVAGDEKSRDMLLSRAIALAGDCAAQYLELRQADPLPGAGHTAAHKALMKLELPDDEDSLWAALPSERRNRVRRARKEGLSVEIGDAAMLDTFYDIWSRNMRDLGSPPHSRAFFKCILEEFPESSRLIFVMHEGNTIGAALAMVWNGVMSVPWVSSLRKYFGLYPNNILYWEALRLAVSMGCSTFDFGRSTVDSGTYQFKLRWGAVPTALNWQFFAVNDSPIPQSTGSEGFGLAIEIWKRLPLFLTNAVGPSIRKNITA